MTDVEDQASLRTGHEDLGKQQENLLAVHFRPPTSSIFAVRVHVEHAHAERVVEEHDEQPDSGAERATRNRVPGQGAGRRSRRGETRRAAGGRRSLGCSSRRSARGGALESAVRYFDLAGVAGENERGAQPAARRLMTASFRIIAHSRLATKNLKKKKKKKKKKNSKNRTFGPLLAG